MKAFQERLKYLRNEKGIGQEELAKELGVSKGIISFWENGQRSPTLGNLLAIANYFHVSIDYLAGLTDEYK